MERKTGGVPLPGALLALSPRAAAVPPAGKRQGGEPQKQ